jgi:hypothetical protein
MKLGIALKVGKKEEILRKRLISVVKIQRKNHGSPKLQNTYGRHASDHTFG